MSRPHSKGAHSTPRECPYAQKYGLENREEWYATASFPRLLADTLPGVAHTLKAVRYALSIALKERHNELIEGSSPFHRPSNSTYKWSKLPLFLFS